MITESYGEGDITMRINNNKAEDVKIAYIGGGSRGWAWGLMSDLCVEEAMSGSVYLYDIDIEAAKKNEVIGNKYNHIKEAKTHWDYKAVDTIDEALNGADFVVISIMPATFKEMYSDVHTPEKYGIYQSVGDTAGPGGIIRALRTVPMFEYIANKIKENCPDAWVINYTNPMTICVRTLYKTFPQIKAFGCCHEVFGTQKFLVKCLKHMRGIEDIKRQDIKIQVTGVNHFTWITKATYKGEDIFPVYREFCEKFKDTGYTLEPGDKNWANGAFFTYDKVKIDLFLRYGYIAAAGDRHLAEFVPGNWYMKDPETVKEWEFALTHVDWRIEQLKERLEKSEKLYSGELPVEIKETGEEGVKQMKAILGLGDFVTNVNIPNRGQIPNLPYDAVVETNAAFREGTVSPVMTGDVPEEIYPMISRTVAEQELIVDACVTKDLKKAFMAFSIDPLVRLNPKDAKKLFDEMVENTKEYLSDYII